MNKYEVIIIGAGHAGVEAALAAARMGCSVLLTTISADNIAQMPCNPAIGGPAKSHIVREVDALGGEMGIAADKACIQMRMLNTGKGPAVHSLRAQADKYLYHQIMKETVENQPGLDVKQLMIEEIITEPAGDKTRVCGVRAETGEFFAAQAVVICSGTFLRSKIIIGELGYEAGPNGQRASIKLAGNIKSLGIVTKRFKTGTPARIDARSVDFSRMIIQSGDEEGHSFSFMTSRESRDKGCIQQRPCWLTYTNADTHRVISSNFHRAPLFSGDIEGTGPRYCPSIEDKVRRFADKERHQLFVEPEGLHTNEMYVQGMSTSLPVDVQLEFLRTIPGLEKVEIIRPGYAIEYDCFDPVQLFPTLEFKIIQGLFSAGQSNGTSGYEEAAGQGLVAGINAALAVQRRQPFILTRAEAYIGTLIDDLTTKGTNEPYRMMTSRSEYRLVLRQDNADSRLTPLGREIGLVKDERWQRYCDKRALVSEGLRWLEENRISPKPEVLCKLAELSSAAITSGITLRELLKRPEITYTDLEKLFSAPACSAEVRQQIEISVKYDGYIKRQSEQIERQKKLEDKKIPDKIDYNQIVHLASEARQKLSAIRPVSVGQAARISGVSPADISVLLIYLMTEYGK